MYAILILDKDQFPQDKNNVGDTFDITATVQVTDANDTVQIVAVNGKSIVPQPTQTPAANKTAEHGDAEA